MQNYPYELYSRHELGDMVALYFKDGDMVSLSVVPASLEAAIPVHKDLVSDEVASRALSKAVNWDIHSLTLEPLVFLTLEGDNNKIATYGASMRNSATAYGMKFVSQERKGSKIETLLKNDAGIELLHVLEYMPGRRYFVVHTEFTNGTDDTVTLEMLESFNLASISPFQKDSGCDKYKIHRYQAMWSAEGRELVNTAEELNLETSWQRCSERCVRFGHRSSKPAQEYYPSLAIEDTEFGVVWAAQLATIGPWQMIVSRNCDFLSMSGGAPDAEFANWRRPVKAGETFISMPAVLTCVKGDADLAFSRLTEYPVLEADYPHGDMDKLPVLFNEWCTTWGKPYPGILRPVLERCKQLGIGYFMMDDGWFAKLGDWGTIKEEEYPDGFAAFTSEMRADGFVLGIWFEFEHCSDDSEVYKSHPEFMVKCHGKEVKLNTRRALDLRKKEVWDYLDSTMVKTIRENGIGYIKSDYNAAITGADTDCGETMNGVCEYCEAVMAYFRHLRELFPELIIENCASGGHRTTAGWLKFADMASFSDVHETLAVPLIAANVLRQIPMCKSQIWATLRPDDTPERLSYTLCSAFLGRFCISGDLDKLPDDSFEIVRQAVEFYDKVRPFVRKGDNSIRRGLASGSYEYPKGWQVVSRRNDGGALYVIHFFGDAPETLEFAVDGKIQAAFNPAQFGIQQHDGVIVLDGIRPFSACSIITN